MTAHQINIIWHKQWLTSVFTILSLYAVDLNFVQAGCVRGPGNKRCPARNAKRELKNIMTTISTSADLDLLSVSAVGCDFDKYSKYSHHYYQIDRVERDIYQDIWMIVFGLFGVIRTSPSLFPVKIASSNEFIIFSIFID